MARKGPTAAIYKFSFVSEQSIFSSDGFELEFSGSSEPELKIFRAESSRAGAF